jgi:TonB-linked SusC/RagA family outer membrane protein
MHARLLPSLLVPLAIVAGLPAGAQTTGRQVTGTVTGTTDSGPLPGVTVLLKGTTNGATTDGQGRFSLTVPAGTEAVLVFSSVGYEPLEVRAGNRTSIEVVRLKESATDLNDVVVVGYGTQRKRDITGAVGSITAAQVAETPIARTEQILQGRVSGVQVTQSNSAPGGGLTVRIRGINSISSGNDPLYVIDGFPGVSDLNSINPADIESIEVLKDASATAIYGSRGANGVVLVTTKRGKAGRNVINLEAYTGLATVRHKYKLMNATQFAQYLNDVQRLTNLETPASARALPYTQAQIDALGDGTDWQDAIFQTGRTDNYQLGFNGGNEETRYNLSFNYFSQKGIVLNSDFKRGTVRFNLDRKISNKLSLGFTSQVAATGENRTLANTNGGSAGGVILDALRFSPINPVRDADGNYTFSNTPLPYVENVGNPVAYAELAQSKYTTLRGLFNVAGNYELAPGLTARVTAGVDGYNVLQSAFLPSTTFLGANTNGAANQNTTFNYSWVNENTLTYDKQFGRIHALNVVAGFSLQQFMNSGTGAGSNNFFSNTLGSDNLGLGANVLTPSSYRNGNQLASYYARANYRLLDKYLFTFTMRADGSSRFGANNKWGYFPSAAVAYRVIDEDFMKGLTAFSDFKIRASYGITGNQEIGSYASQARYGANGYVSGPTRLVGLSPNNIPNPNLTWESTASTDIGLDIGLLKNRLTFTADVYYKKTSDLLLNVSLPQTSGFGSILLNAGSVQNKGLEVALNSVNFDSKAFSWSTNLNFSLNRNKVLDLNGEFERFVGSSSSSIFPGAAGVTNTLRVGQPIGSFYGYVSQGLWQTPDEITASGLTSPKYLPGDPRYADLNGDKKIDGSDRTIIGSAQPNFIYGLTNNFTFGPVSLNVFFQGVQGSDILNLNRYELESGFTTTNKLASVVDRWTGPGTSNSIPKANSTVRRNTGIVSDVIEDGSFLRLKTVTLGYTIPVPSYLGAIKGANIYVTAQNLVTWTNYSGFDPEVNSFGSNALSQNTDYNAYPNQRLYIAGLRLNF